MAKRRRTQAKTLTEQQIERDRATRDKYAHRPSLEQLLASGEFDPPLKQGQYLALMQFAAAIKSLREQQNLSLADLADRSGIDRAAISRLETGQSNNPTFSTLERLAKSVGKRVRIELEDDAAPLSR